MWLAATAAVMDNLDATAEHARRAADLAPDDPNTVFRAAWCLHILRSRLGAPIRRAGEGTGGGLGGSRTVHVSRGCAAPGGATGVLEGQPNIGFGYLRCAYAEQPSAVAADLAGAYLHYGRPQEALEIIDQALGRPDSQWRERLLEQRKQARAQLDP